MYLAAEVGFGATALASATHRARDALTNATVS
jgi:hypothetical protein